MFIIQSKAEALCLLQASETSLHLSKHSQACSPLPTSKGNVPVCLLCVLPKPNWSWCKLQYLPCFYKGNYKSEVFFFFFCKVSYWNHSNLYVNNLLEVELEQWFHTQIVILFPSLEANLLRFFFFFPFHREAKRMKALSSTLNMTLAQDSYIWPSQTPPSQNPHCLTQEMILGWFP